MKKITKNSRKEMERWQVMVIGGEKWGRNREQIWWKVDSSGKQALTTFFFFPFSFSGKIEKALTT